MSEQGNIDREPDISLFGLSILVIDRQFSDASDYWDGNWLDIRATMRETGALVTIEGPILRTDDFVKFRSQLASMHDSLAGVAELGGLEPNLTVKLKLMGLGQIAGEVDITPDHLDQFHRFIIGLDQSYLPALIESLDDVIGRFPVIGSPND